MGRARPWDPEREMQDYLINWNAGPLGVVFRPDLGADMPPVVAQLLPQPSVLKMAGVREGDLLISVNGKKTTRLGYEKVVRLLFKERLPMVLHFRMPLQANTSNNNADANSNGNGNVSAQREPQQLPRGVSGPIAEEPGHQPRGRRRSSSASARPSRQQREVEQRQEKELQQVRLTRGRSNTSAAPRRLSAATGESEAQPKAKKKKNRNGAKAENEAKRQRKQFSVVWERGSLGISFRAYSSKVNVPCVDFISATRGQGRNMEHVCINDVLIAINGEKTKALGVEKVLRWLLVIEKPVVLRFHASSNRILNPSVGLSTPTAGDSREDIGAEFEVPESRPRRPTLPQPEYEPVPRPPRRHNSVDQHNGRALPSQHRQERGYSADHELQPPVSRDSQQSRRQSRDNASFQEMQHQQDLQQHYRLTGEEEIKETPARRHDSIDAYYRRQPKPKVQEREQQVEELTLSTGDFRREPVELYADPGPQDFELRINAHIVPHRRQQSQQPQYDDNHFYQQQLLPPPPPPPTRERAQSHSRSRERSTTPGEKQYQPQYEPQVLDGEEESKPRAPPASPYKQLSVHSDRASARPRLASRDSQTSTSSHMSFDEAAGIVARASGKPAEDCEFGGVPLLNIQDGTVQAKLMFIYAKACVAKEQRSETSADAETQEAKGAPKYEPDANGMLPRTPGNPLGRKGSSNYLSYRILQDGVLESSHTNGDNGYHQTNDRSRSNSTTAAKAQVQAEVDTSAPLPPPVPVMGSRSVSTELPPPPPPVTAPATHMPTEDFISLKDFMVKGDGSLSERQTTRTVTPDHSTDDGEATKADKQSSAVSDAAKPAVVTPDVSATDNENAAVDESEPAAAETVVAVEESKQEQGQEESTDEQENAGEHAHADKDTASIGSSNERELAASVASLDDLLDLPPKDHQHDDDADEVFADDDDEEPKHAHSHSPSSASATPLGAQLTQVQEESGEVEEVEKEEELDEDSALANPLVAELFRSLPDVREVVKDKPALAVLVKKSMIDEIQEILQSLQMELQFERHSTMGVGTPARLPQDSQLSVDMEGKRCYRCDATGELAELTLAGGQRELYCQECWEMFFFNDDRHSASAERGSKTLLPTESSRLAADEEALDEALKYSFHDSSVTREDMIHPWRYLQSSSSMSSMRDSSFRDSSTSNTSSITDRADEVWL